MKKLFLIAAACMFALSASAQKYNVVIGTCTSASNVNSQWSKTLKENIARGFNALARCNVADDSAFNGISSNLGEALSQLQQAGVDCFYVASSIKDLQVSSKAKDGKTTYSSKMSINISLYSKDGGLVDSIDKDFSGSSTEGSNQAILDGFGRVDNYIEWMAENNFLLIGEIRQLQEVHPKKGAKTCYINVGANVGAEKGTIFEVYEEVDIAGDISLEKIGELKIKEVKSATLSLCNVTKGGKKIQESFEAERKLHVQSRPSSWKNPDPLPFL